MSIGVIGVSADVARWADAVENQGRHKADDQTHIVRQLKEQLERHKQRRARRAGRTQRFTATGLMSLDAVLPHGGLPCGAITEIITDGLGVGAMSLAMRIAGNCQRQTASRAPSAGLTEDHRSIVLVDTFKDFYPPAARQHGIALDRLIVLRVTHGRDAFWAVDQSLRCSAVAAVIAPFVQLDERDSRRLQLAAESSGCLGLIVRQPSRRTRSFAAARMLIESVRADEWMGSPVGGMPSPAAGGGRHEVLQDQTCLPATPLPSPLEGGIVRGSRESMAPRAWSPAQASAFPHVSAGDCHVCRITLLKIREGMPVKPFLVDLQHETGALPLHPLPVNRSAAKTG